MARTGFYSRLVDKRNRANIPARSMDAFKWFDQEVGDVKGINRPGLLRTKRFEQVKQPRIGRMYMYAYDPKHKDTLPFYDRFPLIFLVGPAPKGWYGLNMHYLPPVLRAKLFDKLLDFTNNDRFDETTKLRLSYELLGSVSKLRAFEPCFKRYIQGHVKSKMVEVPAAEWENVMYLPTDQFVGANRQTIWQKARKELKNLF
jgi:hypothetical protein